MHSVLEIYMLPAWWHHFLTNAVLLYLYTYLASLYDDGESANSSPSKEGPQDEAGPTFWWWGGRGHVWIRHKWACSELWSLSWLSSLAKESVEWCSAAMPENSDGSNVPFFTFTSSFSRAAAPCWPPFTLFHFILLFWNHTFTCLSVRSRLTAIS